MANPFIERPIVDRLLASPLAFFLHPVYILLLRLRGSPHTPSPTSRPIRVVCISDTHTLEWPDVPPGDLLIHAGDLCNDGSVREIQAAVDWLTALPHAHKVVIAGNHDSYFDPRSRLDEDRDKTLVSVSASTASIQSIDDFDSHRIDWGDNIHYLQHSSITLTFPDPGAGAGAGAAARSRKLNIYGAPQIPTPMSMGPEHAFTYPPSQDAWSGTIPIETDILITHTPPYAHRDLGPAFSIGCPFLLAEVWRVRPKLHVFGHVHFAYGAEPVYWDEAQKAWERLSTRCSRRRSRWGFLYDFFTPRNWFDALRVLVYGVTGIVWSRVWGGESNRGSGWMVNAAAMYKDSGVLRNPPQVFTL
ncbi:Metallo-dependent phosphatase-like protein [Talaromyces proteolyticus]|uniref:Metallo-dependent phosphatase-like protein n=1 Tax=Talaromyces proteolyticus TaxID=1131652 RepID=A0AAD4KGM9_9EURO|nr:Metallo-dependent phosphatase-like protein [Talaromyces proteolyticus]KAH8689947.1 Metallo-dependent phosphatase-like protein [Talaromyces proteolyticus]